MEDKIDKRLSWGAAVEYLSAGTLNVNKRSILPVTAGGRGDLVGSYNNARLVFLTAHANWTF